MNCWGTGHVAGTSAVDYCFSDGEADADISVGQSRGTKTFKDHAKAA